VSDANDPTTVPNSENRIVMSHEEKSGAVRAETGRQAVLAASLLTSAPAWQRIDPLPLLDEADLDNTEGDGESIDIADHLFSNITSTQKG